MRSWLHFIVMLTIILGIAACGQSPAAIPVAANPSLEQLQAQPTKTQITQVKPSPTVAPTPEPTVFIPTPTNTTAAPAAPASPVAAAPTCTNQVEVISQSTYPASELVMGQLFSIVLKLKNTGTCTWTTAYQLVLVGGQQLSKITSVALPNSVQPGETINISHNQIAPKQFGDLVQAWMLQDEAGNRFGLGPLGQDAFVIPFTVRSLEAPKNPYKGKDPCY